MKDDISIPVVRFDAEDKISGRAKYISDIKYENMLYAKTLRSTRARAKILSIEYPDIPNGYFIIDKEDIPKKNRVKVMFDDWPIFAEDEVNYIGEGILLVVGPDKSKVLDIISNIKVNYKELPIIDNIETSEKMGSNVFVDYKYSKGNLVNAEKIAEYKFENEYSTGYQEHIYMEPQGMIGKYERGKITVEGSMQCPYYIKDAICEAFGFEKDNVRIKQTTTGGGFGGKEDYPSLLGCQIAAATVKTRKTVKLIFERNEDIVSTTKRHPSKIKIKAYLDKNYNVIGSDVDIKLDGGAYCGLSNIVLQRSIFEASGVYDIKNIKVRGRVFKTNNIVSGAYRGFGAPQTIFAIEMFMEYIADKVKIDPIEFKKKNYVRKGDKSSTGGTFKENVPIDKITETIEKSSNYKEKYKKYKTSNLISGKLHGIGLSIFFHGGGFTGNGERDIIKTKLKLRKNKDNTVEILVSNVEMGQGLSTTFRKIASKVIGIPMYKVIYNNPDTDKVPNSGPTVASRSILIVGKLIEKASEKIKSMWYDKEEFEVIERYEHPKEIVWDEKNFKGDAYNTYSWGGNVVEVEVDPITFETKIVGIWSAYDVGNAIDEKIVEGQIDGGITQGLGYASMEVLDSDKGKLKQASFSDYIIPTALDFPRINRKFVNIPYYNGPFGAKSVGELTFDGAAPAYTIAVQNAIKCYLNKIPVTPENIMEVVMENEHKI